MMHQTDSIGRANIVLLDAERQDEGDWAYKLSPAAHHHGMKRRVETPWMDVSGERRGLWAEDGEEEGRGGWIEITAETMLYILRE